MWRPCRCRHVTEIRHATRSLAGACARILSRGSGILTAVPVPVTKPEVAWRLQGSAWRRPCLEAGAMLAARVAIFPSLERSELEAYQRLLNMPLVWEQGTLVGILRP